MNLFYQKDDCLQNVILALEWTIDNECTFDFSFKEVFDI